MAQILTCPDDPLLQRFVLGKTTDQEAAEMEQHLVSCPRCVHTLHELKASDTVIEALRARKDIPMEKDDAALKAQMKRLIEMPSAVNEPTIDATSSATPTGPAFDCLSPPLQEGEIGRLAHYRVLKVLGEGGMGTVFQAEDTHLDRLVALKVMKPEVAKNPSAKQRFTREAKTCATLKHDHIVTIYQVGEERGVPFLAMEFLEGLPLDRLLEGNKKLSIAQILRIGKEMAKGLSAAHEKGLIHRDIKPGNIWLDKSNGRVRILDFGLARAAASDDVHLTQSGVIVGTPAYMAPEQARAEEVDARADLFSLGVVLYRLCAGVLPFKGKDTMSMLMALAMDMPRPVREINAAIPAEVADLIMKLLAKNAQDRPQSAKEVVQIIQTIERNLSNASQAALKAPVAPVVPPAAALPAANPFQDLTEARPPVVVPPKSVPRKKPAEKSTPPQASGGRQTPAKMKDQGANAPRSPNRRYLFIGLGALLLPALLLGGWVIIRDKDGNEVAKVKIPDGGQAVVVPGTTPTTTTPAQPPLPVGVRPLPAGPSPFDALKRADISELELANAGDGDPAKAPADLVAVVGDSRFQNWGGANGGLFHRDGQRFFATTNERLFVWDQATGRLLLSRPMSGRIDAFSPDGKRFVTRAGWIVQWDAATGEKMVAGKAAQESRLSSPAYFPNGKRLAVGYPDEIRIFDASTGDQQEAWKGHSQPVRNVAISADGMYLASASGSTDGTLAGEVIVWDTTTGKPLHTFPQAGNRQNFRHFLAFLPDSRQLLRAPGDDSGVRVHDVQTGKEVGSIKGIDGTKTLLLSPNGQRLVGSIKRAPNDANAAWRVWDLAQGYDSVKPLALHPQAEILDISPDSRVLALNLHGMVQFHDLDQEREVFPSEGPAGSVFDLAASPDGKRLEVTTMDGSLRVWDITTGKDLPDLRKNYGYYPFVVLSPDGQTLAAQIGQKIDLVNVANGQTLATILSGSGSGRISGIAFSPNSTQVALTVPGKDVVKICDAKDATERATLKGHAGGTRWVAYGPDGQRLMTYGADKAIRIWDASTGQEQRMLPDLGDTRVIALAPDAKLLAAAVYPHVVVWNLETGREQFRLENQDHTIGIAFSPDGQHLATSHRGEVRLWNTASGEQVRKWPLTGYVKQVTFAPDGRHLLTGNGNGTVYVLRLAEAPQTTSQAAPEGKWQQLFNGKDLTGWKTDPNWTVENGELSCTGSSGYLYTDRDDYGDFHLRAEIRTNDPANGGIFFRASKPINTTTDYEAQIASEKGDTRQRTGSLYNRVITLDIPAVNTWFTYEIIAQGNRIRLLVDGKETANYVEEQPNIRTKGFIVLQHQRGQVSFRKIEIREGK